MKIYTKTGDEGSTSLLGGKRVAKSDLRVDAYGTVDELNACLGILRDQPVNQIRNNFLVHIQDRLFVIGSILASTGEFSSRLPELQAEDIEALEKAIDEMDAQLPPMKNFILPGGHTSISFGHLARTVCRRAERRIIDVHQHEPVSPAVLRYLNRLSDYLFVLCRKMAQELGVEETPWHPKSN